MKKVYVIHVNGVFNGTEVRARSMIEAVRRFSGFNNIKKMRKEDFGGSINWDFHVYEYSYNDRTVPLSEGYYYIVR